MPELSTYSNFLTIVLLILHFPLAQAFVSHARQSRSTASNNGRSFQKLNLSLNEIISEADFLLSKAVETEFGNIGVASSTFKPIFIGGCLIMFSGVLTAFIVSEIIDRADLYESLGEELSGKREKDEYAVFADKEKESIKKAKQSAVITDDSRLPKIADIVDEYND